jgi:hypothetical protein
VIRLGSWRELKKDLRVEAFGGEHQERYSLSVI